MLKTNGQAGAPVMQVNPVQCAQFALMFLARATFNASERQMFDLAEGMLSAIATGRVVVANPPEPPPAAVAEQPSVDAPASAPAVTGSVQ